MSTQRVYDQQAAAQGTNAPPRSRSDTSTSAKGRPRPKSRGSTTSLQSVEVGGSFQPLSQQMAIEHSQTFIQQGVQQYQPMYQHNPEDAILHYSQTQQPLPMDQHMGMPQPEMRPHSQHGYPEMGQYPIQYPNGMPAGLPQQHMHHLRHPSEQFEGSPAPEDSENPDNGGAKRKKGTASSLANDQELRRLLAQYQGKSLKDVAAEVQRNEGSGGKSEKAKQVFAMLWLQDTCRRSTNSVRRDRVFSRYTERCGNERVPTLNPASFGKLVRIIFPNVQTRRLGVRGESKYHYVDLSLFPDDGESFQIQQPPLYFTGETQNEQSRGDSSSEAGNKVHTAQKHINDFIQPEPPMDTADFPAPSASFPRRPSTESTRPGTATQTKEATKMDCHYLNTPIVRIPTTNMPSSLIAALPSVRSTLPATMSSYLAMPSSGSHTIATPSSQDSFVLPDITYYLRSTNYDRHNADALSHLYRSYCIDVIDAFRKVKEKPFFNHHSAYNGKMTVPVAKLFQLEAVAPWIQECDILMYKQMIRFIAPLALQVVPEEVWAVFDRISARLVRHLVAAFEEKCPTHAVVAKVIPAARFANLLKKLRAANGAALHVSGMLEDEKMRTQMWMDFVSMVEPYKVVDESLPPPESLTMIEGILRHDVKTLVSPLDEGFIRAIENEQGSAFSEFLVTYHDSSEDVGLMASATFEDAPVSPLERWVQWLEKLPQVFEKHHPQCLINWHMGFWKSVMTQLGVGGAQSYQAWWYLEAFLGSMLGWLTQMEGLLMCESDQKIMDEQEQLKKRQDETLFAGERDEDKQDYQRRQAMKRKRTDEDVGGEERRTISRNSAINKSDTAANGRTDTENYRSRARSATIALDGAEDDDDDDAEMNELRQGGPLDLPSFSVKGSSPGKGYSPVKRQQGLTLGLGLHDDSGIDLREDLPTKVMGGDLESDLKRLKREWGILSSDGLDGEGEVVVI